MWLSGLRRAYPFKNSKNIVGSNPIISVRFNLSGMLLDFKIIFFFKHEYYFGYLDFIIYTLLALIPLLISIAFFTLAERKAMASIQRRKGPNIVGVWGFLQPFADGLKLIIKEIIIPNKANKFLFIFGSGLTLFLSFLG